MTRRKARAPEGAGAGRRGRRKAHVKTIITQHAREIRVSTERLSYHMILL
jgi:hypothetical protein